MRWLNGNICKSNLNSMFKNNEKSILFLKLLLKQKSNIEMFLCKK